MPAKSAKPWRFSEDLNDLFPHRRRALARKGRFRLSGFPGKPVSGKEPASWGPRVTAGWDRRAQKRVGADGLGWPNLDLRIPQIGTFFRALSGKTDDAGETVDALGSRLPATTNLRFRDFLGTYEIISPKISNPRVAGSSPAGRIFREKLCCHLLSGGQRSSAWLSSGVPV